MDVIAAPPPVDAALLSKPSAALVAKARPGGCSIDVKKRIDADELSAAGLKVWPL